ncbi:hypothetical protein PRIPAC_92077 [Pristionchus pacificus]|nr:hypothetical protein PRIPAC_92077 [Pristionchus pacificus]
MSVLPSVNVEAASEVAENAKKVDVDIYQMLRTPADLNQEKEYAWLQQIRTTQVLERVMSSVKAVGRQLFLGNKMDSRFGVEAEEPKTLRLELLQLIDGKHVNDKMKAVVSLLADNVIQFEITFKHSKSPGGFYRGVAQPQVQWKLAQLQEFGNYIGRASFLLAECNERAKMIFAKNKWDKAAGALIHQSLVEARNALVSANLSVQIPRKRGLKELYNFVPTKKFNPPLPGDKAVSVYMSGPRVFCAVYTVPLDKSSKEQTIQSVLIEAIVPGMPQILARLTSSLRTLQEFLNELEALKSRIP